MTDASRKSHEPAASMAMLPHEYRIMFELEEEYWWYRGLRVLLEKLAAQYLAPDGTFKILDAGCGTGKNLELLLEYGQAYGVDIAQDAIEFCRMRGIPPDRTLVASLLDLPFRDAFFDAAFSFDVICNIQNDVAAMHEIARTLKPGGRVIAQLPAYRWLWSAHDVAVGHKHRYTSRELEDKIKRAGMLVETISYLNVTLFPVIALLRYARRASPSDGATRSDLISLPPPLNALLTRLFTAEMRAVPRLRFPFGISMLIVARKP